MSRSFFSILIRVRSGTPDFSERSLMVNPAADRSAAIAFAVASLMSIWTV
nr:MAG TPA: hypothetical protein [Caudoviricetes sp.]DAQ40372.1 MAG TPA: hypothetical protein [Caudoviricetes sp.]